MVLFGVDGCGRSVETSSIVKTSLRRSGKPPSRRERRILVYFEGTKIYEGPQARVSQMPDERTSTYIVYHGLNQSSSGMAERFKNAVERRVLLVFVQGATMMHPTGNRGYSYFVYYTNNDDFYESGCVDHHMHADNDVIETKQLDDEIKDLHSLVASEISFYGTSEAIGLIGESHGGNVVAHYAFCYGAVRLSFVVLIRSLFLQYTTESRKEETVATPCYVFAGTRDSVFPLELVKASISRARGVNAVLKCFDADHYDDAPGERRELFALIGGCSAEGR